MKYKNIFKLIFKKFPKNVKNETPLSELDFDSMSQIVLIAELEENYDTIIDPSDLGNLNTISDLISFLDKNLSK